MLMVRSQVHSSMAKFRIRSLVRCTGRIGSWLEFEPSSDVRVRARLMFRIKVMRGGCQW